MKQLARKYIQLLVGISLLSLLSIVASEFLFCHNGPQRIRDLDCPGGFVLKKPVNITCAYYYMTDNVPAGSIPQLVENHCDSSDPIDIEPKGDFVKATTFSEFFVNIVDPAADKATPGTLTPADACADSCLAQWIDPDELEYDDHLLDIPPPLPDPRAAAWRERKLSKKVFMKLIMDDTFEEDDPEGFMDVEDPLFYDTNSTQPRIFRLLAKSMQIAYTKCTPYVEEDFLRNVLKALIYMNKLNKKSKMDVGMLEYEKIDGYLENCLNQENKVFKLKGSQCESYHRVDSIEFLKKVNKDEREWKYKVQSRSFVWGLYDPIVETAWAAVDFVHGYCFPSFITNLNHHHMYEIAMEALFPETPVLRHWMMPTVLGKGDVFWNSVLETGNIKVAMTNLDACVVAGYAVSPYKHRLERIFTPESMLETPVYTSVSGNESIPGWTKTIKEYWRYYEAKGGFKRYAKQWGHCLASNDEDSKMKTIAKVKSKCPAPP